MTESEVSSGGSRRLRPEWLTEAQRVDRATYLAVAGTSTPSLNQAMERLSNAADDSKLWLATAAALAVVGSRSARRAAAAGLASVAVASLVVNVVVKAVGRRPRPERPVDHKAAGVVQMPASASFPSGHSASAFAFAAGVASILPVTALPLHAAAGAVAYSRVHTGVHYPGDVIAGSLLGTVIGQLTARSLRRYFGWR